MLANSMARTAAAAAAAAAPAVSSSSRQQQNLTGAASAHWEAFYTAITQQCIIPAYLAVRHGPHAALPLQGVCHPDIHLHAVSHM
jgi:hypothetical protein